MTSSKSPYRSSKLIVDLLSEKSISQSDLASATNVTPAYVNHAISGRRLPSAEWLNLVSTTMGLDETRRKEFHTATAIDLAIRNGYEIDEEG